MHLMRCSHGLKGKTLRLRGKARQFAVNGYLGRGMVQMIQHASSLDAPMGPIATAMIGVLSCWEACSKEGRYETCDMEG